MENEKYQKLRVRAKEIIGDKNLTLKASDFEEVSLLLEEFAAFQIELELQNEELKDAQLMLQLEKERYSDLYHNSPVGYLQLNRNGVILDFNNRAVEILNFSPKQMMKKPLVALIDKEYISDFYEHIESVFNHSGEGNVSLVITITDKFAKKRILKLKSNLLNDKNKKNIYCRSTLEDITQDIENHNKINELNNRLEASMIAGDMAWWEVELPSGKVTFNDNKAAMLGFLPQNFSHYNDFMKLVHPDDVEPTLNAFRQLIYGEVEIYECEYRIKHSDGHYLWFHDIGKITSHQANVFIVNGIVTNINEKKEYQNQLLELNATKDTFFSIIAHDLKNHFTSILGFSELLIKKSHNADAETIKRFAQNIHNATRSTYRLLENLLEWSRSQTGQIKFNPEYYNLDGIVNEAITISKNQAEKKEISITSFVSNSLTVFADHNMINTVMRNLISNALKFTPRGGRVEIRAEQTDTQTFVSVSDNGVGMSQVVQNRLFKISEKITSYGTENENGTGIGLVLCKEFIEKHSGSIGVESELDKGSTFTFSLPKK